MSVLTWLACMLLGGLMLWVTMRMRDNWQAFGHMANALFVACASASFMVYQGSFWWLGYIGVAVAVGLIVYASIWSVAKIPPSNSVLPSYDGRIPDTVDELLGW